MFLIYSKWVNFRVGGLLPHIQYSISVGGDQAGIVGHRLGELTGGRGSQHVALVEPADNTQDIGCHQ